MEEARKLELEEILQHNGGFSPIEDWLQIADSLKFKKVSSRKIVECPACGSKPSHAVGQFIYYSNLVTLVNCGNCGLVFTDRRIDSSVVEEHFEGAYKDTKYFEEARRGIFSQLIELASNALQEGSKVLDVGAATGVLMSRLRDARPDLDVCVQDMSEVALQIARDENSLKTIDKIEEAASESLDLVTLIDVLYYVPDFLGMLKEVERVLKPGGQVIIRLPNKLSLIRLGAGIEKLKASLQKGEVGKPKLRFFNPEHIYLFSQKYIRTTLEKEGFIDIQLLPAKALRSSSPVSKVKTFISELFSFSLARVLRNRPLSPSFLVVCRKPRA